MRASAEEADDMANFETVNVSANPTYGDDDVDCLGSPRGKRRPSIQDYRDRAEQHQAQQLEAQAGRQQCIRRLQNLYPALTLVFCILSAALAAGVITWEGSGETFSTPTNWQHTNFSSTTSFSDFCSSYTEDINNLLPDGAEKPAVGQCQAGKLVIGGSLIAFFFTIMSLPPMQRCGKYMGIWALGIWLGSVLNFTGFIMGQARVPYIVIDASNGASSVKFDYHKLASCDADAYCWPDELMDRYHGMLAFAFLGMILLCLQGVSAWHKRGQYLHAEYDDDKPPLLQPAPQVDDEDDTEKKKKKKKKKKNKDDPENAQV